jgi:hypothetical protein
MSSPEKTHRPTDMKRDTQSADIVEENELRHSHLSIKKESCLASISLRATKRNLTMAESRSPHDP